jgi:hypothetical protein
MIRTIWIVALFLSFSVKADIKIGETPPSYLGNNRSGEEVQLSDMKGKVVVATFLGNLVSSLYERNANT